MGGEIYEQNTSIRIGIKFDRLDVFKLLSLCARDTSLSAVVVGVGVDHDRLCLHYHS